MGAGRNPDALPPHPRYTGSFRDGNDVSPVTADGMRVCKFTTKGEEMSMKHWARLWLLLFAGWLAATPAFAAELTGTLKKVKESGTITMGIRESSYPLSYLDDKQVPIGYHIDICNKIVEAVKKEVQMPNLAVQHQP